MVYKDRKYLNTYHVLLENNYLGSVMRFVDFFYYAAEQKINMRVLLYFVNYSSYIQQPRELMSWVR